MKPPASRAKRIMRQIKYRDSHKESIAIGRKKYYEENKEMLSEKRRAYRLAHRSKETERTRAWRNSNREKVNSSARKYYATYRDKIFLRKYGITPAEIEDRLRKQGLVCAICGEGKWDTCGPRVDHDHGSGLVRGILCAKCNMALGLIGESEKTALSMAAYIKKFKGVNK